MSTIFSVSTTCRPRRLALPVLLLNVGGLAACQNESAPTPAGPTPMTTDAALFAETTASGYTWYVGPRSRCPAATTAPTATSGCA